MLARTLIADRSGDLRVRLLNLNEHPERLPVGLDFGELERVLALEPPRKSGVLRRSRTASSR